MRQLYSLALRAGVRCLRRCCLRFFSPLRLCTRVRSAVEVQRYAQAQQRIAYCLRVPLAECRQNLLANHRFLKGVDSRRVSVQATWRLRRHQRRWDSNDLQPYRHLLRQDPRSRIVATFHFGDFAFGLNLLLREDPGGRERIVLTQRISDAAYFDNMQRAFADAVTTREQQWPIAQCTSARLGNKLRRQAVSLVMFCDLPPAFGATSPVRFLNRQARFPRGAAALATRYRLPLLPVVFFQQAGRHRIAIAPQIEPAPLFGESNRQCVARLTQELCSTLQHYVGRAPEQWRFLSALPAYFDAAVEPGREVAKESCSE